MPPEDELVWCIGPPLRTSFVTLLGAEEFADRAVALYRERFGDIGLFENSLYPDIESVLAVVARPGVRKFVATSKPHVFAKRIIDHFGLAGHFEHVFGSELDGTRVRKDDLLAYALEQIGADPSRALMIGDRGHSRDVRQGPQELPEVESLRPAAKGLAAQTSRHVWERDAQDREGVRARD